MEAELCECALRNHSQPTPALTSDSQDVISACCKREQLKPTHLEVVQHGDVVGVGTAVGNDIERDRREALSTANQDPCELFSGKKS
jgi:hypothetical protein